MGHTVSGSLAEIVNRKESLVRERVEINDALAYEYYG